MVPPPPPPYPPRYPAPPRPVRSAASRESSVLQPGDVLDAAPVQRLAAASQLPWDGSGLRVEYPPPSAQPNHCLVTDTVQILPDVALRCIRMVSSGFLLPPARFIPPESIINAVLHMCIFTSVRMAAITAFIDISNLIYRTLSMLVCPVVKGKG